MFPKHVAVAIDILACLFLGVQFLAYVITTRRYPIGVTLVGMFVSSVCFLAVISCAGPAPTLPPAPSTKTKLSPCAVTLEAFCSKGQTCGYFEKRGCMARGAPECDTIQGITPTEAEVCAYALGKTSCQEMVPLECVSIAEPVTVSPSTLDL